MSRIRAAMQGQIAVLFHLQCEQILLYAFAPQLCGLDFIPPHPKPQRQTAVSADLKSDQLPHFASALYPTCV